MSDAGQPAFNFSKLPRVSREAFEVYHAENPRILEKLAEYALQAKRAGATHFGIRMLWERLRWYTTVDARHDPFKLNDHYHAFYARLLMEKYPELEGLFELRKSIADRSR